MHFSSILFLGDHVLTACAVAKQLNIVSRPVLLLSAKSGIPQFPSEDDKVFKTDDDDDDDDEKKNPEIPKNISSILFWKSIDEKYEFPLNFGKKPLFSLNQNWDFCCS